MPKVQVRVLFVSRHATVFAGLQNSLCMRCAVPAEHAQVVLGDAIVSAALSGLQFVQYFCCPWGHLKAGS